MMAQFTPTSFGRIVPTIVALIFSGAFLQPTFGEEPNTTASTKTSSKNLSRIDSSPKSVSPPQTSRLIMKNDAISCPLPEGESTFIISFLRISRLDRLTFVNENANVKGEMRIAVSNHRLPADSPKWIEVSGKTAFTQKRRLYLSMVGVEARFVKLSFHVKRRGGHVPPLARNARLKLSPMGTPAA